jgi:hypothetical protein
MHNGLQVTSCLEHIWLEALHLIVTHAQKNHTPKALGLNKHDNSIAKQLGIRKQLVCSYTIPYNPSP